MPGQVESDRQVLIDAKAAGGLAPLGAFMRLSGPGWMQSAITLGGGSLASSLYLGVLAGYDLLWLQPLAMILGIVMLSAIGYVTLSTGQRPFRAINEHVNPVLGWGWVLAVAAANIVWCLPQYSLSNGVLSQNLFPSVFGDDGWIVHQAAALLGSEHWLGQNGHKLVVVVVILVTCTFITWRYDRGGWGVRLYERLLKILVALIVLCFVGVVGVLSFSAESLEWGAIGRGIIPDFSKFLRPVDAFLPLLEAIGPVGNAAREYWVSLLVDQQRDVMISAAATAVGINMTFLFAYSMLRKGWTKEFRGLAVFDLSTGMLIPFILATGCVVIASASQFHTIIDPEFVIDTGTGEVTPPERLAKKYQALLVGREMAPGLTEEPTALPEKKLAAVLVKRDAMDLAKSLEPLTGGSIADIIFGVGVLAMTLSTISLLMLISGFVFCEILGLPPGGWPHRLGTLLAGVGGAFGPFIWKDAAFYLAVPTSVFGFVLLPLAYLTFFLLMNQNSLLGEEAPRGFKRLVWNVLMGISAGAATIGSLYMTWVKARYVGVAAVVGFVLLALLVQINRYNTRRHDRAVEDVSA